MQTLSRLSWRAILGLVLLCPWRISSADHLPCRDHRILVDAQLTTDFTSACDTATRVIHFMQGHQFKIPESIRIKVSDTLSGWHPHAYFGSFDPRSDEVEVMSLKTFLNTPDKRELFGIPLNKDLHQSFTAHEVAHAIAFANTPRPAPARVMQEYIAYSVQIATMPSATQKQVIDNARVGAFQSLREISMTYLELNPEYFAIKAYLHMMQPENGSAFYQQILSGSE